MGRQESHCLDDDTLLDMVQGRLDHAGSSRLEDHVSRCAECRRLLSALARSVAPRGAAESESESESESDSEQQRGSGESLLPGDHIYGYQIISRVPERKPAP